MRWGFHYHAEALLQWERTPVPIAQEAWWAPGQIYANVNENDYILITNFDALIIIYS